MDHERETLIEAALGEINPHYRAALVLRELEGLSYDEIAEILETSLGTVKSRILRGREALRAAVNRASAAGKCACRLESKDGGRGMRYHPGNLRNRGLHRRGAAESFREGSRLRNCGPRCG